MAVKFDPILGELREEDGGTGGGSYRLPIATATTLGGVKVGAGLNVDPDTGVLSASGGGLSVIASATRPELANGAACFWFRPTDGQMLLVVRYGGNYKEVELS